MSILIIILRILAAFLLASIFAILFTQSHVRLFPDTRKSTRRWVGCGIIMVFGAFFAALFLG